MRRRGTGAYGSGDGAPLARDCARAGDAELDIPAISSSIAPNGDGARPAPAEAEVAPAAAAADGAGAAADRSIVWKSLWKSRARIASKCGRALSLSAAVSSYVSSPRATGSVHGSQRAEQM